MKTESTPHDPTTMGGDLIIPWQMSPSPIHLRGLRKSPCLYHGLVMNEGKSSFSTLRSSPTHGITVSL